MRDLRKGEGGGGGGEEEVDGRDRQTEGGRRDEGEK